MFLKKMKDESGQALVITIVGGTLLLVLMGLAIDVGVLFREKRRLQDAADAAATAAALDYHYNQSVTGAQAVGKTASSINGYTDGTNGASVTINMPPSAGPNTGYTSFAEAIVKSPKYAGFMGMAGFSSVDIYSRAVAGNPAASKGCGYTGTLTLQGAYSVSGTPSGCGSTYPQACGIFVSSTSSSAVSLTGNGGCFDANFLDVAGGLSANGGHNTKPTPTTTNLGSVAGDPFVTQLSTVPQPASAAGGGGCSSTFTGAITITAANQATYQATAAKPVVCFTGAVTISNGQTVNFAGLNSTQSPNASALYVFQNGLTMATTTTVSFGSGTYNSGTNSFSSTSGATVELWGGSLSQASSNILNIYAPTYGTSGTTNGIALWQPTSNASTLQVQFGSNNEVLDGFIYAPGADVTLHDNGGGVTATGFVSASMTLNSSSLVLPNYNTANQSTTPLTEVVLVE
jgi:hypothetical protein